MAAQLASSLSPSAAGGIRVSGVEVEAQAGLGGEFHGLEVEVEVADGGMAESLAAAAVEFDVVQAQCWRNSSLWVESSPTRVMRALS